MKDFLQADDGFSLLELLVAIAVLSLAVIPMLGNQNYALKSAARLQEKGLAQLVAGNVAATMRASDILPEIGRATGSEEQGGIRFSWTSTVRQLPGQNILMIDVSVEKEGTPEVLASQNAFRSSRQ